VTVEPRPRSPLPVAVAHDVVLSPQTRWLECDLYPGESYRLRALVEAGPGTGERAALLRFDLPSWSIGSAQTHLCTGDGLYRTDRVFSVRDRVRRLGLLGSPGAGPVVMRTLTIERADPVDRPADIFLSVDVEAWSQRTSGDPIDRLVWGRIGGHEYGIPRICAILEEHGLVGNFMVDFATCAARGDAALREIIDHVRGRGHEVHLHLHPELLDPSLGYLLDHNPVHFDRTPLAMSRSLLELALESYTRFVGEGPFVFRAGGYRVNEHTVRAAGELGIHALTNVKPHTIGDVAVGGDEISYREPFVWDNGVVEIPVDASSPEMGPFKNYVDRYRNAVARKPIRSTFNVVMHSWSLLLRDSNGHHESPAPEYEDRLHQICAHAARHGRVRGYAEYLGTLRPELPVRRVAQIRVSRRPDLTCTICDAAFEKGDLATCLSCGLGVTHRLLRFALDEYGDLFAGREVLGLDLSAAESDALLDTACRVLSVPGSCDGVLWLGDPDRAAELARVVDVVARSLRPGGVFVFVGSSSDGLSGLLGRHFIPATLPAIDPVTGAVGTVSLAYAPGGDVAPLEIPEWILRLRSLRAGLPSLLHIGAEYARARVARHLPAGAKRAIRRVGGLPRRGARLVRRVVRRA
jgi:hypothetical protein